jgi:hypothetical protein
VDGRNPDHGWCALTTIAIIYPGIGTAHPDASLPEGFEGERLQYTLSQVIPLVVMILVGLLFYALGAPTRRQARADTASSQAVPDRKPVQRPLVQRTPVERSLVSEASSSDTTSSDTTSDKPRPVKRPRRPVAVWQPVPPSRARLPDPDRVAGSAAGRTSPPA